MTDTTSPEAAHAASEFDDDGPRGESLPEGFCICALFCCVFALIALGGVVVPVLVALADVVGFALFVALH